MDERDWDLAMLAVLIAALAGISVFHTRVLKSFGETLMRHDEDITFLRLVTRGLEEKVAD